MDFGSSQHEPSLKTLPDIQILIKIKKCVITLSKNTKYKNQCDPFYPVVHAKKMPVGGLIVSFYI